MTSNTEKKTLDAELVVRQLRKLDDTINDKITEAGKRAAERAAARVRNSIAKRQRAILAKASDEQRERAVKMYAAGGGVLRELPADEIIDAEFEDAEDAAAE